MISNENIIIMNVENSEIIQQYAIREIKKILDKYKNIRTEELRSVEKLVNSISNKELKEEFLNDWSMSVKLAKETGDNEADDRVISMFQTNEFLEQKLVIADNAINTESNSWYHVLKRNLFKLGIDYTVFDQY